MSDYISDKTDVSSSVVTKSRNDSNNNNPYEDDKDSQIVKFLKGRSIFITGASGFLGKVLIEKILRTCPEIQNIYMLLRSKKGQNPKQRLEALVNSNLFDRVRNEHGIGIFNKLVFVSGDMTQPKLGVEEDDLKKMIKDVSVVFHSAATVRFDEPMKVAVELNVLGTRRLVELCHKLPRLEALIHVSTAYANCDRHEIDEVVYPMSVTPQSVIDTTEWVDEENLNKMTPAMLGTRPNTYTFTKALAENLLVEEAGGLPVAIVRPSIVTAAWKEPFPGWIDNLNGPTGLLTAIAKGVVKSVILDGKCDADFIPVDVAINLMLAVALHTATRKPNNMIVYNCTSGCVNALSWSLIRDHSLPIIYKYPSLDVYRYPGGSTKTNRAAHNIAILFHHYFPAAAMDLVSLAIGKKASMIKLYNKIHKAFGSLEYFTMNEWKFHCKNVLALGQEMNKVDKDMFSFDIKDLDWYEYMETYMLGIRQYVMKEDNSTIPAARRHLKRMSLAYKIANAGIFIALWKFVFSRSTVVNSLTWFGINTLVRLYNAIPFDSLWPTNPSLTS